jgi:hypothetical protein
LEFHRFDTTAKDVVWEDPPGWLDRLRVPRPGPVEVVDTGITAISATADKVLLVKAA